MTAATGFKRLGIAIAAVVLASFAALGAMALLIPVDTVRDAAKAEIRNVTGLDLVLRGDVAVSLFPTGSISFANVTLGDDAKPVLAADRLTARLRFFPLFAGRIEIADVSLVRPRINVTFDATGIRTGPALVDALARALGPKANRPVDATSFTEIRINDGTIALQDATRGIDETFKNVELALAWPSISKSFAATGRFVWHDEPIDAAITLTDFAAALAGDRSGLKIRLAGAPVKFAFEGNWSTRPTLQIEGTLAADAPSLRDTLRWAGLKPLSGGGFGRFALKAKTNVSGGTIALSTVNVELDGNVAEGVLAFATDGRQTLQGTLAADELDLTPYVSTIRLLTSNERDWNRVPLVDRRPDRRRSRPAAVGRPHHAWPRQARAHRRRRQPARRQASRDDRRIAGVRRRAQGLDGARGLRCRRRVQVATAIHRRRSRKMPGRHVPVPPHRRPRRHGGCHRCHRQQRAGDDADAERNGQSERPAGLAGGLERRATAAPPGAAAAVRNGRFPQRPHAVREAHGRLQDHRRHRHRRERQSRRIEGPARAGRLGLHPGARFRSARGRLARRRPARPTRRRPSNCRSWCRARGTTRSCCRTPRP